MKRSFLYRLARYSKAGFVAVILFVIAYAVVFFKKMDMAIFPYNAMFSLEPAAALHTDTYAIKLDDSLIHITQFPYWKKDFLEMSLKNYALYRQQGQSLYMHQYLATNTWLPAEISKKLVPQKKEAIGWPGWYLHFAGYKGKGKHKLTIMRYRLNFTQGKPSIEDSSVIITQQINIR
jgi:hypothetical protein